jgi:hypothetical protein
MIRNKFLSSITERLNDNSFSYNDFDIEINEVYSGLQINIKITYRYIEEYTFSFSLSKTPDTELTIERTPGKVIMNEKITIKNQNSIPAEITVWVNAIKEEMSYMPFAREFEETKSKILEMEEKFNEVPEKYFTKEESELLKKRLETLEVEFEEKLRKELDDKFNLEYEVRSMKAEMEQLKIQVEILNKRNWIKSFGTKLHGWGTKYPVITAALATIGIGFLPEEVKDLIPHEELINVFLPEAANETPKLVESTEKEKVTNQ